VGKKLKKRQKPKKRDLNKKRKNVYYICGYKHPFLHFRHHQLFMLVFLASSLATPTYALHLE